MGTQKPQEKGTLNRPFRVPASQMIRLALIFLLIAPSLIAAPRPWRSADGKRSVQGEFLSRDTDSVTIRRRDRTEIAIPLAQLHAGDRAWLDSSHPLPVVIPPPSPVFDRLTFTDDRGQVLEKLKTSPLVELTVAETFLARTGLNGVFRTREKIGGLDGSLYFDWTESNELSEITLQTEAFPATDLDDKLVPCWRECVALLTTLHGQPIHENPELDLAPIRDGAISGTHVWKLEDRGSALVGASRHGETYQVIVRFTRDEIAPVPLPREPKQPTASN